MGWFNIVFPMLFISLFMYGFMKQLQQSLFLNKTISPTSPFNKRLLAGNHLFSFSFGGFVLLLILNIFVYVEILPQTQQIGNAISLVSLLFLLLMFISKFAIIPKVQVHSVRPLYKRIQQRCLCKIQAALKQKYPFSRNLLKGYSIYLLTFCIFLLPYLIQNLTECFNWLRT